jgi:DNA-binding CsgD family transcriptional regulator
MPGYKAMSRLTKREDEVLALIGRKLSCKVIAHVLDISEFTVRKHRASILRKMRLQSAAQLTVLAMGLQHHDDVPGATVQPSSSPGTSSGITSNNGASAHIGPKNSVPRNGGASHANATAAGLEADRMPKGSAASF